MQNDKRKNLLIFSGVIFVLLSVVSFSFFVTSAKAAVGINRQINFQGKLVDNNGLNVADSTYTVVFSLYSTSSGGSAIWTETDSVTTKAGIFQVQLGATTSLPDNVYFNSDSLYLGIKVGSDLEMTPRIRFTAVPYAINSASLDGVVATQSATGFTMQGGTSSQSTLSFTNNGSALTFQPGVSEGLTLDTNGANTLSLGNSANVINFGGTNNPTYEFKGTGGVTFDGTTISLANSSSSTIQTTGADTGLTILSKGAGNIILGQNAGNGNVVISPNAGGQAAIIIKDNGSGDLLTASAGAVTKFTINNAGQVLLPTQGSTGGLVIGGDTTLYRSGTTALTSNATTLNFGSAALTVASCSGCVSTLGFNNISGGANTSAAMVVGSGASLNFTGTGTINASSLNGATFAAPGTIGGTTPGAATFTTATINSTGNALTLAGNGANINFSGTGTGQILTAVNQNLVLDPGPNGDVGINASTNLAAALDVRGNTATTPGASVSADSTFAAMVVNNSGSGDLFAASKSGATKFVINNEGTVTLDTVNYNACGTLATDANGNIYCSSAGAKETIASVYTITAPSGTNLHINFTGAAGSSPSSASGTITFPANTTKLAVQLKGAGGGGGGVGTGNGVKAGGGGGEGGYSQKVITSLVTDYYVKVGGGGTAGATTPTAGGQGTATCIGTNSSDACNSPLASATGGSGGTVAAVGVSEPGGAGGVGANGDVNITGQSGAISVAITGGNGGGGGGIGGATGLGVSGGTGNNGVNGGGGSGGYSTANATTSTGGKGGDGYISFTVYTNAAGVSTGDGWLQYASGVLAPLSSTTDVLIGSNATTSADFAFMNVDAGTPTASISAGSVTTGASYLTGTGILSTTNNQTLTLGGATTGNVVINPLAGNYVGIGTQNPLASLDIRGATGLNGGTVPVASFSGQTSFAAIQVNNNGIGDLLTASKSGATKFTILNNGNISWAGTNNVLSTFASTATSAQTWTLPNLTGTICVSGQSCATSGIVGFLQRNAGAIAPGFITDDLLVGGTATTSAKFAVINMVGSGTPTASLSAGTNGGAYFNATGTIQTTANQSLTIGGNTTGNILINPSAGNYVGIGTENPQASLDIREASGLGGGTLPVASVAGTTSFAAMVVNNSGTGDLFTASSAGASKFTIKNSGSVVFGGNDTTISASGSGAVNNGSGAVENVLGDEGSLVPNAGFEAFNALGGFADGWVTSATSSGTVARDTSTQAKGNGSAKITGNAGQFAAFYSACMPLALTNAAGAALGSYNLAYYARTTSATILPTVRAYVDGYTSQVNCNQNKAAIPSNPISTTALGANTNWNAITGATVAFTGTPASLTWGRVHFYLAFGTAASQVNIDGVRLIQTANTNGLDYAENYPADHNDVPQPGDIVALEATGGASLVAKADKLGQAVLGVVSTKPGYVLDDGTVPDPKVPVALAGRVPVKVSTLNGPIHVGDYLTSSSIPGVAVKATSAGSVIGTAMNDFDCSSTFDMQAIVSGNGICQGTVTVFIKNTWYDPSVTSSNGNYDLLKNADLSLFDASNSATASDSGILQAYYTIQTGAGIAVDSTAAFEKATIGNIQAGAVVAKEISTDSLKVTTGNIMLGSQTLHDYIASVVNEVIAQNAQKNPQVTITSVDGLTTISANAQAVQEFTKEQQAIASQSSLLAIDTDKLDKGLKVLNDESNVLAAATSSAQTTPILMITTTPAASDSSDLGIAGLTVAGKTTISGDVRVKGNGLIEGILHVADTLFANNVVVNGISEFFGNVIFHQDVTFEGRPTVNSDTAGFAIIKKGTDHVDVKFAKAYDQVPVVNASLSMTSLTPTPSETADALQKRQSELEKSLLAANIHFIITNKTTTGFTILLDRPADEDIAFEWLALSVHNPVIFQSDHQSQISPSPESSPSPIESIIPTESPPVSASP